MIHERKKEWKPASQPSSERTNERVSRSREEKFFSEAREERKEKESPAEYAYWKNILRMVYHLRKTIILLSIFFLRFFFAFTHKRVESGKFSPPVWEKLLHFIKYSLSLACSSLFCWNWRIQQYLAEAVSEWVREVLRKYHSRIRTRRVFTIHQLVYLVE